MMRTDVSELAPPPESPETHARLGASGEWLLHVVGATVEHPARPGERGFRAELPEFSLRAGELIGLVGPSGSGKSTFLDLLAMVSEPKALEGFFLQIRDGDSRQRLDLTAAVAYQKVDRLTALRARYVGYITQGGALLPYLTVEENTALAARLSGQSSGGDLRQRIQALATRIGIGGLLRRYPSQLSGGERQRAAVLRSLAVGSQIVIADEPTAALDPRMAREVMTQVTALATEFGAGVVCASHDEPLLREFGFSIRRVLPELSDDETTTISKIEPALSGDGVDA